MIRGICGSLTLGVIGLGGTSLSAQTAVNSTDYVPCSNAEAVIHEVSPRFGLNDFQGVEQTVVGAGYSRAACLKPDGTARWHVEAAVDRIDEPTFKATAAVATVGVSFRPAGRDSNFTLYPTVRFGYEQIEGLDDNFVYGAGLAASNSFSLSKGADDEAWKAPQFVVAGRVDYVDRRSSDPGRNVTIQSNARTTVYGEAGFDLPLGDSWRSRITGGYQTLDGAAFPGYAVVHLGVRPTPEGSRTYPWNFSVTGNFYGDRYQGILLSVTKRFVQARR